jgi:hypothetical protein
MDSTTKLVISQYSNSIELLLVVAIDLSGGWKIGVLTSNELSIEYSMTEKII